VGRWRETFREHRSNQAPTSLHGAGECVAWLIDEADRLGMGFGELLEAKLEAYWGEEWPRRHRSNPTPQNLLRQLPRLAGPAGASGWDPDDWRRRVAAAKAERDAAIAADDDPRREAAERALAELRRERREREKAA
jgi:hypothetical protein